MSEGAAEKPAERAELATIGAILALAAAMRLWRLDLAQFHFDDGVALIFGRQALAGQWPLVGLKTSLNFYNPPLFVYLTALPLALARNPLVAIGAVALANVGAVALCWRIARRGRGGAAAGLLAALLMALSPCAILASRRIYAQYCLAPITGGILLACQRALEGKKRKRDAFWIAFLGGCLPQIHYSGLAVVAALGAAGVWLRPRICWRGFVWGAGAAALASAPYLVHLAQSDFADARMILGAIAGKGEGVAPSPRWQAAAYALNLPGDADAAQILDNAYGPVAEALPGYTVARWAMCLAWAGGLAGLAWRAARRKGGAEERLWLAWILVPLGLYSAIRLTAIPSYVFILFPLPYILAAQTLARLASPGRWRRARAAAVAAFVAAWGALQAGFWFEACAWLEEKGGAEAPYVPYRDQRAACGFIAERIEPGAARAAQNDWSPSAGVGYNYLYLIDWLRAPKPGEILFSASIANPRMEFRIVEWPYARQHGKSSADAGFSLSPGMRRISFGALSVDWVERPFSEIAA